MKEALSPEQISLALESLPGWLYEDSKLMRTYVFATFPDAMAFMVKVGFAAEAQNHHPELFNVYNRVAIALNTHDAGGQVTEKDTRLAQVIDTISIQAGAES